MRPRALITRQTEVVMAELQLRFPRWIGVVCADFESQRRFYRDVLALGEVDQGEG